MTTTNPWGGSSPLATHEHAPNGTGNHNLNHSPTTASLASLIDVGLLKSALLPSLSLNASLALAAYAAARATDRLEIKDLVWPVAPVLNAWWAATATTSTTTTTTISSSSLSRPEKTILAGITAWGVRLAARVVQRMVRRGPGHERPALRAGQAPARRRRRRRRRLPRREAPAGRRVLELGVGDFLPARGAVPSRHCAARYRAVPRPARGPG